MKAINQYIVIDKIKEQPTKIAGLEITEDLDADNRYAKGKVITHGKFAEGVNAVSYTHLTLPTKA